MGCFGSYLEIIFASEKLMRFLFLCGFFVVSIPLCLHKICEFPGQINNSRKLKTSLHFNRFSLHPRFLYFKFSANRRRIFFIFRIMKNYRFLSFRFGRYRMTKLILPYFHCIPVRIYSLSPVFRKLFGEFRPEKNNHGGIRSP